MIARGKREARRPLVTGNQVKRALKVRNIIAIITLFQSFMVVYVWTRGDAPRSARRLPLAIIFRAVGAASDRIPTFEAKPCTAISCLLVVTAFGSA